MSTLKSSRTDTWDQRFVHLAECVAQWSKDPSTKVGAVIVRPDKTIASMGFNGFPRGTSDDVGLYEDRQEKYARIVHAELNAILFARERLDGYTIYNWREPTCAACAGAVIQAGITRVVSPPPTEDFLSRWSASLDSAFAMYREAGVAVDYVGEVRD